MTSSIALWCGCTRRSRTSACMPETIKKSSALPWRRNDLRRPPMRIRLALFWVLIVAVPLDAAEPPFTVDRGDIVQLVRERGSLDAASAIEIVAPAGGTKDKPLVIKWLI